MIVAWKRGPPLVQFFSSSLPRAAFQMAQKRPAKEQRNGWRKTKKQKKSILHEISNDDVLLADIRSLRAKAKIEDQPRELPEEQSEVELNISELSSTGDGLAEKDGQIYVVPFTAPGDTVRAKVYKNMQEEAYSLTDFQIVVTASKHRTETPRCQYFAACSGCQFQHMPYSYQLAHKRRVIQKAYANFAGLPPSSVPEVRETVGSPLQYGYRTKLTPHFDGPPNGRKDKRAGKKVTWSEVPPIGFMKKGTRKTIDIEDCPIGTEVVRLGMASERKRVSRDIDKYQRGATLLLRESTERLAMPDAPSNGVDGAVNSMSDAVLEDRGGHIHRKTCITDHKATSTEFIDDFRFDSPAGAFFQNNNSILPLVTQYIRDNITEATQDNDSANKPQIKNIVDAYSGSGVFTITLSALFTNSIGIDISADSIASATRNAELNNLPASSTKFIAADASSLFESLDPLTFKPEATAVVLDPPRKGCDESFIKQLIKFGPERICYVSCNVHTQARDVGWLVAGFEQDGERSGGLYEIESLRGFDFFPQTGHVESIAILHKHSNKASEDKENDQSSTG